MSQQQQQQQQSAPQRPPAADQPAAGQLGASAVSAEGGKPSIWAGFYKKTILERQDQIKLVYPQLNPTQELPATVADNMIENCIGTYELPLGLGLNFQINGVHLVVPMATEEPSVIAAVSGAAKTIQMAGGFKATSSGNIMLSQIQILDVEDPIAAARLILDNKIELIAYGNTFCPSMVKRGGGVVDIRPRVLKYDRSKYVESVDLDEHVSKYEKIDLDELVTRFDKTRVYPAGVNPPAEEPNTENKKDHMLIVHVYIDVCESMGANLVTTVAEGLSPKIVEISGGRALVRIVSNLVDERRAKASFLLPINLLKYKGMDGTQVAKGILEAFALASEDQYRAATHNKGIMNGIDAAAIALGQDWRAIEAAAHAWAARSGRYRPLTSYKLVKDSKTGKMFLFGTCEMPVAIGVRGGAIQAHPVMAYTHGLVGNPTSRQLGEVLVCIGLAQNFAAIRAIVSEGIQRGHMSLHSRTIAIGAGAPPHLVQEVSNYMISVNKIDQETAADYLRAHSILANSTQHRFFKAQRQTSPSTLFVELDLQGVKVNLNIVFETIGGESVQLALREEFSSIVANGATSPSKSESAKDDESPPPIQKELFGEKSPAWFKRMFEMLSNIRVSGKPQQRTHHVQQNKLKLLSILMNVLIYRLVKLYPDDTAEFLERVLSAELNPLSKIAEDKPPTVRVGFSLLLALWQVFKHQVDAIVSVPALANALKEEQLRIFSALFRTPEVYKSAKTLDRFMSTHSKRFQSSMFLLCDLYGLPDNLITPERLFLIFKLGQYFEWEGIVAHDVARWERDLAEDAPNVYSFWLRISNLKPDSTNLQKFLGEIDKQLQSKKRKLLEAKVPVDVMDARKVLDATKILRQHYGLAKGASPAINKLPNAKL